MKVAFNGLLDTTATFVAGSGVASGDLVEIGSNSEVTSAETGKAPIGLVAKLEADNCVAVQLKGYMEVEYSGNAPSVGYASLTTGSSSSKVKLAGEKDGAIDVLILTVDVTKKIVGFIL